MSIQKGQEPEIKKTLNLYRRLLAISGSVYLSWWLLVESLLPNSFNPLLGRALVVLSIYLVLGLSYKIYWVQRHLRTLFMAACWLITFHYFYLFYGNAGDVNWVVGAFITVIAINLGLLSNTSLLSYSIFVVFISSIIVYLLPSLTHSVFLPGIITIVLQANMGLRSRLGVIKRLTESNERFELLFNSTFEGVLVHENGYIVDTNRALTRMVKYQRDDLIGMHLFELIHPDDHKIVEEKMKILDLGPFETRGLTKENKIIDVEVRAKSFVYSKRPARLVTVQDISDRKRAERDRIAASTLAENLRLRDDFISIASHELKTPITALQLQLDIIDRNMQKESLPEKYREAIALFSRQVLRLTELVETLLDVPSISGGKFNLEIKNFNLTELVRESIRTLPIPKGSKTSAAMIELDSPEQIWIHADQSRLEQVIENMLTNALKYGDGNSIAVRLSVQNKRALIEFEDHGIGIAPEYITRIFDRFERAISARHITGFGLGLYIVRKIVEAHGGTISVESRLGIGSTFTVSLPVHGAK